MRLDRNINADGLGKYALVAVRKLHPATREHLTNESHFVSFPREAVETGAGFFVIKYTDRFAAHALSAYLIAVRSEVKELLSEAMGICDASRNGRMPVADAVAALKGITAKAADLAEYAEDLAAEVEKARQTTVDGPHDLIRETVPQTGPEPAPQYAVRCSMRCQTSRGVTQCVKPEGHPGDHEFPEAP
jgi:hypothetical protein